MNKRSRGFALDPQLLISLKHGTYHSIQSREFIQARRDESSHQSTRSRVSSPTSPSTLPLFSLTTPSCSLVYLEEEDGLLHFYYKDLSSSSVVEDLIIFPGDATFKIANKSNKVSVLKFNSSSARHFFWHQDQGLSEDEFEARGKRVNELIGGETEEGEAETTSGMEVEAA